MRIIGGLFKGRILKAPKGDLTRPTSSQLREALFNICQGEFENASVLDLCSGSGAVGIEALSRGATTAYFVESNKLAQSALKENLKLLKIDGFVLPIDAVKALQLFQKSGTSFDFIYIDPPYEAQQKKIAPASSLASRLLNILDKSTILKPHGRLFIEEGGEFERVEPLESLKLIKTRTFGKSYLFEFSH